MIIRRCRWQTLTIVPALCAGAWLTLAAGDAFAQSTSMSGSGGSSSSSGGGSSGGSSSSLLGSTGSGTSSQTISSTTTNNLLGSANSLTSSGLTSSGLGTGGLTGGASGYTPNGRTGPSPSNMLASYYANPLAAGMPNAATGTTKPFGQPIFVPANNNLNSANVSGRGTSGGGGLGSTGTIAPTTMSVGPRYTSGIGWKPNPNTVASAGNIRLQTELQSVIANATNLSNPRGIQVSMDGGTVVLRGTAADPHERTLAAAIISMSPGVYGVRNEIKVGPPGAGPATTPAGAVAIPAGAPGTAGSPVRQP